MCSVSSISVGYIHRMTLGGLPHKVKAKNRLVNPRIVRMVKKYGIPMLVTSDESLKEYLQTILQQVQGEESRTAGLKVPRGHS